MSAVAGPLERLLSNPDTRVDDVLDLVDSLIEGADVDRDGTLLTGLRQRLEEIASERGGEWTRLLVAAARLRSLLEARGVVVGDATPAAVAVGVEAPPAPAPVSAPDVEAEAGPERVLDERPVNHSKREREDSAMSSGTPDPPPSSRPRQFWNRRSWIGKTALVVGAIFVLLFIIGIALPTPDEDDESPPEAVNESEAPQEQTTTEEAEATTEERETGTLCRQPGIRYAGTTAQGAEVCFTLTPDGSAWVEIGLSFVQASGCPDTATGTAYSEGPAPLDAPGRIKISGFTATIRGARASGVLEDSSICGSRKFKWSARRQP